MRRNAAHFHSTCTRNRSCGKRQFKQLRRLPGILTIHLKEITDLKQHNVIRVGGFYLVVSPFSGRRFFWSRLDGFFGQCLRCFRLSFHGCIGSDFLGLILLACFLWRNEPPGFCQSIVILDHLRPWKLYAGAVRLAVANVFSVSPDITHKIAGECVVTTADAVFIFQRLQLFLCGVRCLVKSVNSGAAVR